MGAIQTHAIMEEHVYLNHGHHFLCANVQMTTKGSIAKLRVSMNEEMGIEL